MTKNIPLFTFVFSAYKATQQYSHQRSSLHKHIDKLSSDNVRVLSELRKKMQNSSHLRVVFQKERSNHSTAVTMLFVENDSSARRSIVKIADRENIAILHGRNVKEAMSILRSRQDIRIIFVDAYTSASTSVINWVKTVGKLWPNIYIVLTSSHRVINTFDWPRQCLFIKAPVESRWLVAVLRGLANQVEYSPAFASDFAPHVLGARAEDLDVEAPANRQRKRRSAPRAVDALQKGRSQGVDAHKKGPLAGS